MFVTTARFPPLAVHVVAALGFVKYPCRVLKSTLTWCTPASTLPAAAALPFPNFPIHRMARYT